MKKQDVLDLLAGMPEEIDADELINRVYVLAKLDRAEADVAAGRLLSHEELVRESDEWLR